MKKLIYTEKEQMKIDKGGREDNNTDRGGGGGIEMKAYIVMVGGCGSGRGSELVPKSEDVAHSCYNLRYTTNARGGGGGTTDGLCLPYKY